MGEQLTDGIASSSSTSYLTPSQRAHLVQQVIDRTAMLSSQGGGTIRLDLSSADLGRMELAVAMDEGRVNLRVLTGSDGMRSAILSDMTRLKETLGLQNIQLGQVDVGVAGQQTSNSGQGFGGQSSFNQSRNFSRDDFDRSLAQMIGTRNIARPTTSDSPQIAPLSPTEPLIGNGRISLRI
jgi:flagellar hook-length control protein FliK